MTSSEDASLVWLDVRSDAATRCNRAVFDRMAVLRQRAPLQLVAREKYGIFFSASNSEQTSGKTIRGAPTTRRTAMLPCFVMPLLHGAWRTALPCFVMPLRIWPTTSIVVTRSSLSSGRAACVLCFVYRRALPTAGLGH